MQATTDPKKIAMKETNHIEGSKGKINVSHPVSRLGFKIKRASLLGVTYNILLNGHYRRRDCICQQNAYREGIRGYNTDSSNV